MATTTKRTQPAKTKNYKLIVQIGKTKRKGKRLVFNTDDPVATLLSVKVPKLTEGVRITLKKDGKEANRGLLAFQARRVFAAKLHAFYLIKTMHWILK